MPRARVGCASLTRCADAKISLASRKFSDFLELSRPGASVSRPGAGQKFKQSISLQGKTNFFEKRVAEYQKATCDIPWIWHA